jgi:mRNA interferase RelE/StbE
VKRRLEKKLEVYLLKPLYYAKKLTDNDIGTYRWRIGNYRIVFDIDGKNIVILRVDIEERFIGEGRSEE